MQVCTSLQTGNHASTPPLKFFTGRMPFSAFDAVGWAAGRTANMMRRILKNYFKQQRMLESTMNHKLSNTQYSEYTTNTAAAMTVSTIL